MCKKSFALVLATLLSWGGVSLHAQTLAGLQLWLKPEGLTNTAPLSKIPFWVNSVGGGNDAANSIVVNQPTFVPGGLNGYPVVRFLDNGSSVANNPNLNWLSSPLPLSGNSNSFTAVILFESQITGARDTLIQQLGTPGSTICYVQSNGVPGLNPNINTFASSRELPSPQAYGVRNWTILTLVQDALAGTVTIYQNGSALATTNIGTVATLANGGWLFGCNKNKSTHGLNGDIAEVLLYGAALDSTARGVTENYLASKFGFVVLTDNFNTPDTFNLEANLASRQSGSAAPAGYFWNSGQIVGNEVRMELPAPIGFETDIFTPKVNFITNESGSFKLSYNITSLTNVTGNPFETWAGVVIRSANSLVNPVQPDGFNSIIFHNGGHVDFINGSQVGGGNFPTPLPPPYLIELIVQNNVLTYVMNRTNILGIYNLPCAGANVVSLSLGTSVGASVTYDNFSFTATPIAGEILPDLPATLQLADAFTAADSSDINATAVARQTGAAAPILWNTNGNLNTVLSLSGNALLLTNTPGGGAAVGMVSSGADLRQFEHLNSFRMRFTVSGTNDATSNDSWVGVRLRDTRGARFVASEDGGGTGLNLFTGDGRWFLFQSNLGATNTLAVPASGRVAVSNSYAFDIEVRNNVMRMKINGQSLLLGCGSETYQLSPAQVANFVTLQCFAAAPATAAYARFDDFRFESLDPGFIIPAPTLLNPTYQPTGPAFSLSVNTSNQIFYALDCKASLSVSNWTYLGGLVGNGGLVTYTNSPVTNNAAFYRVRVP